MGLKNIGLKIFRSQKYFGPQKIWVSKKFGSKNFLVPSFLKIWVPKNFGPVKNLGPKNIKDPKEFVFMNIYAQ